MTERFATAVAGGDLEVLVRLLAPDSEQVTGISFVTTPDKLTHVD